MRTIGRVISLLAAVCLLASCGGDSVTGSAGIAGTYNLQTVNGAPLPFTIPTGTNSSISLVSQSLTLNASGSFSSSGVQRTTTNGVPVTETINCTGTWVLAGTTLSTTEVVSGNCGGTDTGVWDGASKLTFTFPGPVVAVYTK